VDNLHSIDLSQIYSRDVFQDMVGCKVSNFPERRKKPRVDFDYPAIVEGIDQQGKTYKENAKLANLSASGLYMWAECDIEHDSKLSVTVLLSSMLSDMETPKLATKGIVVRTEPQTNGTCGVAVKFSHYRFI
jgi:hypothetical protein